MTGATVTFKHLNGSSYSAPNELVGDGFKSLVRSNALRSEEEFIIDLKEPKIPHTLFSINRFNKRDLHYICHIRVGDVSTDYSVDNTVVYQEITDGGFFELTEQVSG